MSRLVTIAAAQMGPVQLANSHVDVVERIIGILREPAGQGAETLLDFDRYRVPEAYPSITRLRGAIPPPEESR